MNQLKSLGDFSQWLRNVDPRIYEQFTQLLADHVNFITVALTEAAPADVLVAQGRAQEARKLFRLLTETRKPAA